MLEKIKKLFRPKNQFIPFNQIQRITIKDDDILILKLDRPITVEQSKSLRKSFEKLNTGLAKPLEIIALEPGIEISGVISAGTSDDDANPNKEPKPVCSSNTFLYFD
jgi:hypothetical protein